LVRKVLTILSDDHTLHECVSCENFRVNVVSDSDPTKIYEVALGVNFNPQGDETVRRWTCTCRGFTTRRSIPNYECKHIRAVKIEQWCGWTQRVHGSKAVKHGAEPNIDYTCPNCGRMAYAEGVLNTPTLTSEEE